MVLKLVMEISRVVFWFGMIVLLVVIWREVSDLKYFNIIYCYLEFNGNV